MSEPSTSVLVVDESILTAELVADHLRRRSSLTIVGVADGARPAEAMIRRLQPTVIVIDRVPGLLSDAFLVDAIRRADSALVLHGTMPPRDSIGYLRSVGVEVVALKEVGRMNELVDAVHQAAATRDRQQTSSDH